MKRDVASEFWFAICHGLDTSHFDLADTAPPEDDNQLRAMGVFNPDSYRHRWEADRQERSSGRAMTRSARG